MLGEFDVIVIGSGFGGGTSALRLARAGKRVCVLERGRRWRGENLPPRPEYPDATVFPRPGDSHLLWGPQLSNPTRQRLGLLDLRILPELFGFVGAGVGGGSLVWSNVVVKPAESVFAAGWPRGTTLPALEPYYRRAAAYLKPALVPGIPGVPDPIKGRRIMRAELLQQTASALGHTWKPVTTAIHFGDEDNAHSQGHGRALQKGCNYCARCNSGCPRGAKNQVDLTYLAEAEALGAEVRALHQVTAVHPVAGGCRVHFRRYALDGRVVENGCLEAPYVVLAAGAFGTTELLLRMKARGMLSALSPALGTRFSVNGNVTGAGVKSTKPDPGVDYNNGPAITGLIDMQDCVVEDLVIPPWFINFVGAGTLERMRFLAGVMLGKSVDIEQEKRKAKDVVIWGGNGMDRACGRLKLNSLGRLSLEWPGGLANEPVFARLHAVMAELARAQGRKYIPNIASSFGKQATVHPLGGCAMADSPDNGVVDACGRVFGYPGLFIADGSVVPTALGRNPSFTIAALAERTAEHMLADMGTG
ncbi:MAG TPA: GMC family oxidoreductase [Candidatus Obscuribacterales bacterium]